MTARQIATDRLFKALERSQLPQAAILDEINALIGRLSKDRKKRGAKPREEVKGHELAAALIYLEQPLGSDGEPQRSVRDIVDEAIKAVEPTNKLKGKSLGFDPAIKSAVHERRVRRLIDRIKESGWIGPRDRVAASINEGGWIDHDQIPTK